ncbi:MAG: DUF1206 domain-containing protein [Acidimicrobiales bacterium]
MAGDRSSILTRSSAARVANGAAEGGIRETGDDVSRRAGELGRRFQTIGRIGWAAKGVVYLLVGVLAMSLALDGASSDEDASTGGAIASIAERPFGNVLVVVVGIGLVLYALWRLFTVVLPGDWTGKALAERVGYLFSAVAYGSLALTIAQVARTGNGEQAANQEDRMVSDWVGRLMDDTAGRWLVGLAGVVVAGVAIAFAHKAITRSFEDDLRFIPDEHRRAAVVRSGQVGFLARAVSFALIAFFLVRAAITYNAQEVGGIDGSLRQFTDYPWGRAVVGAVAVGFGIYGLFCVLSAKYQCLRGPHND